VRGLRPCVPTLLLVFGVFLPVHGQEVHIVGGAGDRAVRIANEVLARGNYQVIARDTVLGPEYRNPGDLVVWDADVRVEGAVEGSALVFGGRLHVRPGARIAGPIVAIRGLALPSGLATVGEVVELTPGRAVLLEAGPDTMRVTVIPPPRPPAVGVPAFWGFRAISYDRVDGVSVGWGPQWRIARAEFGPTLDAWGILRSARAPLGGGAELRLPLPGGVLAEARVERATLTADEWIRGALANSVEALLFGRDVRDYLESDRVVLTLRRPPRHALVEGEAGIEPFLAFSSSRDRSLATRSVWALTARSALERPNPDIDQARIGSAVVGAFLQWVGAASEISARASIEHAPAVWSDLTFSRFSGDGTFRTAGLWNDDIRVRAHLRGIIGNEPAPAQRWTHVGGPGTLPTLPAASIRGDNLAFLESAYSLPVPLVQLPFLGVPALRIALATGTAWQTGTGMPRWEQNLAGGLELAIFRFHAVVDPRVERPRPLFLLELAAP
jgi:hypothetical protein